MTNIFVAEMVGTALLVLLSAILHASWNFLLKRAGGTQVVMSLSKVAEVVVFAPIFLLAFVPVLPSLREALWWAGIASIGVAMNYIALSRAYRLGDLSFVYPIARGAILVFLSYAAHWRVTDDPATKLGVFSTAPAIRNPLANVFTEVVGTFVLVFGVLAIGDHFNKASAGTDLQAAFSSGLSPLLVGFLVLAIGLSLGGPTGYAINPARDLGPRIAHQLLPIPGKGHSDWGYAWVPVVGPIIGGILGGLVYRGLYL